MRRVAPLEPDRERERRVRQRLRSRPQHRAPFLARTAIMFAILFGAVTATAMAGRIWRAARQHATWLMPRRNEPAKEASLALPRLVVAKPEPEIADAIVAESSARSGDRSTVERSDRAPEAAHRARSIERHSALPTPVETSPSSPVHAGSVSASSSAASPEAPAPAPGPSVFSMSGPGAALMIEAMQARRAGDMARAARFLNEYRAKYPDGALSEEALALSIEAAAAGNDGSAAELARNYLTRFPHGRFRERVERVLQATPR